MLHEIILKQNQKEQQKREHQPHGCLCCCCCYAHLSTEATIAEIRQNTQRMVGVHAKPNEQRAFSNAFFGPNEFAYGYCLEHFNQCALVPAAIANNDFLMSAYFSFSKFIPWKPITECKFSESFKSGAHFLPMHSNMFISQLPSACPLVQHSLTLAANVIFFFGFVRPWHYVISAC